jgi:hypothetical protein
MRSTETKLNMRKKRSRVKVLVGLVVSVVALVLAAHDKYALKVPGGLAFSEFRGYEAWKAKWIECTHIADDIRGFYPRTPSPPFRVFDISPAIRSRI